jgi:hypothetical protein
MVSRENRVILASLALVALLAVAARLTGLGDDSAVGVFLVVVGAGILLPQLYLARTDEGVDPGRRVRVGAFLTALFAFAIANGAPAFERRVLATVGLALLVALLVREAVAGYRDSLAG